MKSIVISFAIAAIVLATGGCSRNASGELVATSAMPEERTATVTLADGSRYQGQLVSKSGSEMTFRGINGATRSFAAGDIQSIRFADAEATLNAGASARSTQVRQSTATRRAVTPSTRKQSVIAIGTGISVRNNDGIDSKTASAGQTFSAVVVSDVLDESGRVAIPKGADATLIVAKAGAGKLRANDLALDLVSVSVNGTRHDVRTGTFYQKGKDGVGVNKRTALYSGGAAGVGALIGGIVGGGKGAAIGAASGAGAGAGTQILTRGSVKIASETLLMFRLEAPLAL